MNGLEPDPSAPAADQVPAPEPMMRAVTRIAIAVAIVALVLLLDQLTKVWAVAALSDGPVNIFGTTVQLVLVRNPGSAFGVIQGFTPLLAVVAIIISVILVRMLRRATSPLLIVALSLVLGGALGNLCDRFFRSPGVLQGHVIDFVKISFWPVFNVADAALTIGVVLLVWWSWRR